MVQYAKVDLTNANIVQRYMAKERLDFQDYMYLFAFVLLYFCARPSIQKAAKWWMSTEEQRQGEEAYEDFMRKQATRQIRDGVTANDVSILQNSNGVATGSNVDGSSEVSNRKVKDKSDTDEIMGWDREPARKPQAGDRSDIVAWMDRWTKEEQS
jgi:hypothetical protein